jgi:hypothetical protein
MGPVSIPNGITTPAFTHQLGDVDSPKSRVRREEANSKNEEPIKR